MTKEKNGFDEKKQDARRDAKREEWIDCAKLVAIAAVIVDHCNGFLYTKPIVATASYYSVSLFVLLSGVSLQIAYERGGGGISFANQFQKVKKLLFAYAVATFVGICIIEKRFDLRRYLEYLLNCNIQAPYYYLVFFIQLLMIAPLLINWCNFVNGKKYKWIIHLLSLCFLGWFSYISINYTYILPVHGGGQFLCGGTYVILYYLGILLASNGVFKKDRKKRLIIVVLSSILSVVWVLQMSKGVLPFDRWMSPYWDTGFNPPSVNFMTYSLFILFLCYSVFTLLGEYEGSVVAHRFVKLLCFLGKNTLYIWLYHLYVSSFLANKFPNLAGKNFFVRIIVFLTIITLPAILKQFVEMFFKFYQRHICQNESEWRDS